jgi:hypothetical protein
MAERAYIIEIEQKMHNSFFISFAEESCGVSLCPIAYAPGEYVFTTSMLLAFIDCLDLNFYRFFNSDDALTAERMKSLNDLLVYLNQQLIKNVVS